MMYFNHVGTEIAIGYTRQYEKPILKGFRQDHPSAYDAHRVHTQRSGIFAKKNMLVLDDLPQTSCSQ